LLCIFGVVLVAASALSVDHDDSACKEGALPETPEPVPQPAVDAGLNDTMVTNATSSSFAPICAKAPAAQAGPEDIAQIEPQDSLVVT
jgi:hypothetical protein